MSRLTGATRCAWFANDGCRRRGSSAKRANAEVTQIFETAADGMRVIDRNFIVLRANDTFAELVGLPKQDILGKKGYKLVAKFVMDAIKGIADPDPDAQPNLLTLIEMTDDGDSFSGEFEVRVAQIIPKGR